MRTTLFRRALAGIAGVALVAGSVLVAAPAAQAASAALFASPAPSAYLASNTVTVTGIADPEGADIAIDGRTPVALSVDGIGKFTHIFTGLSEGAHQVSVSSAGADVSTLDFTVDTVAPVVSVTSPAGNIHMGSGMFRVAGTVSDANPMSSGVLHNGSPIFSGTGTVFNDFAYTMSWEEGEHLVQAVATDLAGNVGTADVLVIIDKTSPEVAFAVRQGARDWAPIVYDFYNPPTVYIDPTLPIELQVTANESGTWFANIDGLTVVQFPSVSAGVPSEWTVPAPGWTNEDAHAGLIRFDDLAHNMRQVTPTLRADVTKPQVALATPGKTLTVGDVVTGTASDSASGVAAVEVDFRKLRADDTCGAVRFSGLATLTGGTWSLELPATAETGEFCLRATATDNVGQTRRALADGPVTVDVTGPRAPRQLKPSGEVWSLDTLKWKAVDDAVGYEYRLAADPSLLEDADIVAVSTNTAAVAVEPGAWYWQVRGLDEFGNVGVWSDVAEAVELAVPEFDDCGVPLLCGLFGDELFLTWEAVPEADAYQVEYTWVGDPDDASDDIVKKRTVWPSGTATEAAQLHFGKNLPDGTWSVRVRVVLDHQIDPDSTRRGPFSAAIEVERDGTRPERPVVLGPSAGSVLTNPDVQLRWTDDASVVFWQLKLSTTNERGPAGNNLRHPDETLMVFDPQGIALFVLLAGDIGDLEGDPAQLEALLANPSCAAIEEFISESGDVDELGFICGDAEFVLSQLDDGTYWWQVRGYDLISFLGELFGGLSSGCECDDPSAGLHGPGRWSQIASFVVDRDYVAPSGDGGTPDAGPGSPGSGGGGAGGAGGAAVTDAPEVPESDGSAGSDGAGSDSGGSGDAGSSDGGSDDGGTASGSDADMDDTASSDGDFTLAWLIGGIVLIVLVGGGALVFFLRRRP
jgi:hypothetical protein